MINGNELVKIGQFRKPHGTKGEITIVITNPAFTDLIADFPSTNVIADSTVSDVIADLTRNPLFLICELDGIFVPFRIKNYRFISDSTAYIQLKNIVSDQQARMFINKEIYYPKKYIEENAENSSFTWDDFIDFILIDEQLGKIGRIVDVDTTTINTLFIVKKGNEEILIPAVEEFILRIDEDRKELVVELPEGLVE